MICGEIYDRVKAMIGVGEESKTKLNESRFCRLLESTVASMAPLSAAVGVTPVQERLTLESVFPLPDEFAAATVFALSYFVTMKPEMKRLCDAEVDGLIARIPADIGGTVETISAK